MSDEAAQQTPNRSKPIDSLTHYELRRLHSERKRLRILETNRKKIETLESYSSTFKLELQQKEQEHVKALLQYYRCPVAHDPERLSDCADLFSNGGEPPERFKDIDFISIRQTADEIWCHDECYVHVDMNCFFASVEIRDNPSLRGLPVGVGTQQMLATCNYEARKFGIKAGVPSYMARRMCPNLILVPPNIEKYAEASRLFFDVVKRYDDEFISIGLDECSFDISYIAAWKSIASLDAFIKNFVVHVYNNTRGLRACCGVAVTRALAKQTCSLRKPDDNYILLPRYSLAYLCSLKINSLHGIGRATSATLEQLCNIRTLFDGMSQAHRLKLLYAPYSYERFVRICCGLYYIKRADGKKTTGASRSFTPTHSLGVALKLVETLTIKLWRQIQADDVQGSRLRVAIQLHKLPRYKRVAVVHKVDYDTLLVTAFNLFIDIVNSLHSERYEFRKVLHTYLENRLAYNNTQMSNCCVRYIGLHFSP